MTIMFNGILHFPPFLRKCRKKNLFHFFKITYSKKKVIKLLELHFLWFVFSISMFFANVYPTYINYKSTNIKKGKTKRIKIILTFSQYQWKKICNNLKQPSLPLPKIFFLEYYYDKISVCVKKHWTKWREYVKLMLLIKNVYLRCKKFSICLVMFWVGKCHSVRIGNFEFWVWF